MDTPDTIRRAQGNAPRDPATQAANGGPTLTHALLPGSPAIDAGDDSVLGLPLNLAADQRGPGFPRLQGAHVDIGVFELEVAAVTCNGLNATIVGTDGPDHIVGTSGDDVIASLDGDDTVLSMEGNDTICLGEGDDFGGGGPGRDLIYGENGDDFLNGGPGKARIFGEDGDDDLPGAGGGDRLYGG